MPLFAQLTASPLVTACWQVIGDGEANDWMEHIYADVPKSASRRCMVCEKWVQSAGNPSVAFDHKPVSTAWCTCCKSGVNSATREQIVRQYFDMRAPAGSDAMRELAKAAHGKYTMGSLDRLAIMAKALKWSRVEVTIGFAIFMTYGSTEMQTAHCVMPGKVDDEHGDHSCQMTKLLAHFCDVDDESNVTPERTLPAQADEQPRAKRARLPV